MKVYLHRAGATRDQKITKIQEWSRFMNYKYLFNINYSFRIRTEAVFAGNTPHIFDFFIADDTKFEQFYLYQNLWRETLLLDFLKEDPRVAKVINFGQLPNKVIFREIQEQQGITLEDYISIMTGSHSHTNSNKQSADNTLQNSEMKPTNHMSSQQDIEPANTNQLKQTLFTEYQTIKIAINIIDLLDVLHCRNIVHSNLNPTNVFLREGDIEKMCF